MKLLTSLLLACLASTTSCGKPKDQSQSTTQHKVKPTTQPPTPTPPPSKKCFPEGFLIGTATASAQVEGGWNELGRTTSIWDDFCREKDGVACSNVADDMIHRYKDDLQLMKQFGMQTFRLSISWSRVMNWNNDQGRMVANPAGIQFYHDLIDEVTANGIIPVVTMHHWDLPSELHKNLEPKGWLNDKIVDHYVDFADLCLHEFGRKVTLWSTFNEPWTIAVNGYGSGVHAPGMTNSSTNSYVAGHNMIRSHAYAVKLMRELKAKGVVSSDAQVSMNFNTDYVFPLDPNNPKDVAAQSRFLDFMLGWFLEPLVTGEYPQTMRERVGDRLPSFGAEEVELVKGSYDLIMLNHYGSHYVTDCDSPKSKTNCSSLTIGWAQDRGVDDSQLLPGSRQSNKGPDGKELCGWFSGFPDGYMGVLKRAHDYDAKAKILLTENGWCGNDVIDNQDQLWFYQGYLAKVWDAIQVGIPIIGYTAWSFVDNYEWGSYAPRFGLFHANYAEDVGARNETTPGSEYLKRTPRPAATWLSEVAKTGCM